MAAVIKVGEQDPKLFTRLESISVSDHLSEARLVVEASREKSRAMLKEAQVEAIQIGRVAEERGYKAGFKRGYEVGKGAGHQAAFDAAKVEFSTDHARLIEAMHDTISRYQELKRDLFIAARNDVLRFAVKVAEKVTKQVGVVNRNAATTNLEAALREVESKTDIVVTINPVDMLTMERFCEDLMQHAKDAENFTIIADEAVEPGGCTVGTPNVSIDATVSTQMKQIAELIVGEEGGTV